MERTKGVKESKTQDKPLYQYQDSLPSLPVPPLEDTMKKLVRSAEPYLSEIELEHMKSVVKDFQDGPGKQLQEMLVDRSKSMRNWVRFFNTITYCCSP